MSSVSKNLATIHEKITIACVKRPSELQNYTPRLVAVSKTKPKELIIEAYKAGQFYFGENYVQEIVEKAHDSQIQSECPDIKWHFIGRLQSNKVKKLLQVPNLYVVETVDSEKLATKISKELKNLGGCSNLNIFLQVNTSGEQEKSGCTPQEVIKLAKFITENCLNLKLMGLMTIGKYDNYDSIEGINPDFKCLIDCRSKVCEELGIDINNFELSMGMSGDFEHAIEVGSTNVRVGSLIFGQRS